MEKLFAYEYFNNKGDGTNAAIAAGYSKKTAPQQATRLLKRVQVKQILEDLNSKLQNKAIVTKEKLINELESIALFDLRTLYDDNGALLPVTAAPAAWLNSLTGIEIQEIFAGSGEDRQHIGNTVKIKMNNKISAIETILDTMGWKAPRKIANTDADGKDITPPLNDSQVNEILLALRKKK